MGVEARANPFGAWKKADGVNPSKTYDRNGRELGIGDTVHLLNKTDIMWRVTKASPILDPGMPEGLVELQMHAVFVVPVQGGVPIGDIIKTRDASENPESGKPA